MNAWEVEFENEKVEKYYIKCFKEGLISKDDNKIILKWIEIVESFGPDQLLKSKFWNDHPLHGEWEGCRSSSFSNLGRIIYKIKNKKLIVSVIKVTPDHNYERGNK